MASSALGLWSRHLYTVIYEANRGRIDNPNLIYPGQVFRIPGSASDKSRRLTPLFPTRALPARECRRGLFSFDRAAGDESRDDKRFNVSVDFGADPSCRLAVHRDVRGGVAVLFMLVRSRRHRPDRHGVVSISFAIRIV